MFKKNLDLKLVKEQADEIPRMSPVKNRFSPLRPHIVILILILVVSFPSFAQNNTQDDAQKNAQEKKQQNALIKKLALAVWRGDFEKARELLRADISINKKISLPDGHSMSLLHLPVITRNFNLARLLMAVGNANPNIIDSKGKIPLHYLARYPSMDIIPTFNLMLKKSVNINRQDEEGKTPLHIAVLKRNKLMIHLLLSAKADPNRPDNKGRIPLHYAVMEGPQKKSTLFIPIDAKEDIGEHLSVFIGDDPDDYEEEGEEAEEEEDEEDEEEDEETKSNLIVISMLLAAGSNIDYLDNNDEAPLHLALQDINLTEASILLQNKADPNKKDKHGFYPIHHALLLDPPNPNFLKYLLFETNVDVDKKDHHGNTPLNLAVSREYPEAINWLIGNKQANPDIPDICGSTPMHTAAINGDLHTMVILAYSEVLSQIKGNFLYDIFSIKRKNQRLNSEDNILKIIEKFAPVIKRRVNAMDRSKNTPLHYTALHSSLKDEILSAMLTLLIINGADISLKNCYEMTPLDMATHELTFIELENIQHMNN